MSATINWRVGTMECYPTYEQNTDVVFTVHWDCLGSEVVSGSTYNGRVYGATGVTYHSGSTFTPYNQLSQDVVLGWVWDSIGTNQKSNYENSVQTQINNQINPPVVILPLPWTPPSIAQQPQSAAVLSGSSVTFTVVAGGPSDLSYQWSKDSNSITNAVSSSYIIESVQDSDAGEYTVLVSGNNGQTINSNPATLTIIPPTPPPTPLPPTITEQPLNQTVVVGDGAVFNVNASGESPFAYQWFKDDTEIVGATGNTHIIQTSTLNDAGIYKATVTNIAGTTTSNTATLTVTIPPPTPTPPVIIEQPSSQTIIVGDGAVFNVNATGELPFSYQWFKNNTEIVGATGNTYIIQTSTLNDAGDYKATVTNIAGVTTSNTATLTVNE